jgi:hypothetical protein
MITPSVLATASNPLLVTMPELLINRPDFALSSPDPKIAFRIYLAQQWVVFNMIVLASCAVCSLVIGLVDLFPGALWIEAVLEFWFWRLTRFEPEDMWDPYETAIGKMIYF